MALAPSPARNASTAATSAGAQQPPERLLRGEGAGRGQVVEPGALVQDGGRGRARADRVRGDAGAAQLDGQRADEAGHAGLRGAVGGEHRQAAGGGGRGDGQEAPVPRFRAAQQGGHRHPGQGQHAAEVDVEHGLLLLGRKLPGRDSAGDDARGRDRRVQPAPAILGQPHGGGDGRVTGVGLCGDDGRMAGLRAGRPRPRGPGRRAIPARYGRAGSSAHRSTATTRHPPAARAVTVAAPMPRAAPVTSATRDVTAVPCPGRRPAPPAAR